MHAWSEVEHDLVYKPLQGTLSDEEALAILDLAERPGCWPVRSPWNASERRQRAVQQQKRRLFQKASMAALYLGQII